MNPRDTSMVEIHGVEFPGRSCAPESDGAAYINIHVGIRNLKETIDLVPGDVVSAKWMAEVKVKTGDGGVFDFAGPYVFGQRDDRHLGLRWGTIPEPVTFEVFRGVKLRLNEVDPALVQHALTDARRLVARLCMTDKAGMPICATVKPPFIRWSVST